jgi:hypothetical protein
MELQQVRTFANQDMVGTLTQGKIAARDENVARLLEWIPWLSFFAISLPLPIIFLVLFFSAASTEGAAVYLFLSLMGGAVGLGAALILVLVLLLYRKRWRRKLRDKLASDGITASEVDWFLPELTSAERKTLSEIKSRSPLLADAYCETLAGRLMATRLINRTKKDLMLVERRINRLALIKGADTRSMQKELLEDRAKLAEVKQAAASRLAETQARMQMIEAAASRDVSHGETYLMQERLSLAQEHLPLVIEMAQMERRALEEAEQDLKEITTPGQ